VAVASRWLPVVVALAAATAEAAGWPGLAFYLLLFAVPVNAASALTTLGQLLDARAAGPVEPAVMVEPFLRGLALALLVAGTAAGSTVFALGGCLAVYAVLAFVELGAELRRPVPEAA
jgi:hypothetical protein